MQKLITYHILVIDDESTRNNDYYKIAALAKLRDGNNAEFKLKIINDPQEALLHVASPLTPHYHLVLLDAILAKEKNPVDRIIQELSKKGLHYALISSGWDNTMADTARDSARNYHPISWYRFPKTDEDFQAMASMLAVICHNLAGQARPQDPYAPVDILHLSDLHFGAFGKKEIQAVEVRLNAIVEYFAKQPVEVRFVSITGDISDNGLPHEYLQADEWIQKLLDRLEGQSGTRPNLLTVPGNHDHCVALENAYRVFYNRTTKEIEFGNVPAELNDQTRLVADYALAPYREIWHKHHGCNIEPSETLRRALGLPMPTPQIWIDTRFLWQGLVFYGINTSSRSLGQPPINKIDPDTLASFQSHLQKLDQALLKQGFDLPFQLCPILLIHHPHQELKSDLNALRTNRLFPDVVLDGHGHSPSSDIDQGNVLVVSSGTAHNSVHRPEDSLRSVNWIRLTYDQDENKRVVVVHPLHYSANDGGWTEFKDSAKKYSISSNGDIDRLRS